MSNKLKSEEANTFKEEFIQKELEWLNGKFKSKDLGNTIYDTIRSATMRMTAAMCEFMFLRDGLPIIKEDKKLYDELDKETKEKLKHNTQELDKILNKLEKLLLSITDKLAEN